MKQNNEIYKIVVDLYTEKNRRGNCARYYVRSIRGNRIKYAGVDCAKTYTRYNNAMRAAKKVKEMYISPYVFVSIHGDKHTKSISV